MKSRPSHLPDFTTFPLNEVVFGIQFEPPNEYKEILAKDVWELYREEFPICEAQQPLSPVFETFGPPKPLQPSINLRSGPIHTRYWFINDEGDRLLQFQENRFLQNWRKTAKGKSTYPRFEAMIEAFSKYVGKLDRYFADLASNSLEINQCELTYTNLITDPERPNTFPNASDWILLGEVGNNDVENIQLTLTRQVKLREGSVARMYYEINHALSASQKERALQLQLTVRGAPQGSDMETIVGFFESARDMIVTEFARITTPQAHSIWGRKK